MSSAQNSRECVWRDSATLHVLGQLDDGASNAFVEHLGACAGCRAEFAEAQEVVAEIDLAAARADAAALPPALRERLLARVAAEPALERTWRHWPASLPSGAVGDGAAAGQYTVGAEAGAWEPIGIDGIEVKRLATDAARRYVTMLVRMAPGTAYPPHRHAGDEECFVISGDLKVGERELRGGDYQMARAGSVHEVQASERGCLLFITSSQDDVMVG